MNIIELAKEAGFICVDGRATFARLDIHSQLERFAALVRADLMKQVMNTCESEYDKYDKMVEEDDMGHDEAVAMIHLMRKLEKLK